MNEVGDSAPSERYKQTEADGQSTWWRTWAIKQHMLCHLETRRRYGDGSKAFG